VAGKTKDQLEAEVSALQKHIASLALGARALYLVERKTNGMQKTVAFAFSAIILAHMLCGYWGIPSQLNGLNGWLLAVLAAAVLVGYLSQIAMMLKSDFRLKTKISSTGAQFDAAVTSVRPEKSASNTRSVAVRKS
jgi:hypothetical protein